MPDTAQSERTATLYDGTVLHFPAQTTDQVVAATAKRITVQRRQGVAAPAAPAATPQQSILQRVQGYSQGKGAGPAATRLGLGVGEFAKDVLNPGEPLIEDTNGKESLYHKYLRDPVYEQSKEAQEAKAAGHKYEYLAHDVAAMIPFAGPIAAQAAKEIGGGDYTGGAVTALASLLAGKGMVEGGKTSIEKVAEGVKKFKAASTSPAGEAAASKVAALAPPSPQAAPIAPKLSTPVGEGTRAVELAEKAPEPPDAPGGQLASMRHEAQRLEDGLRDSRVPTEQKEAARTKLASMRESISDLEQSSTPASPGAQATPRITTEPSSPLQEASTRVSTALSRTKQLPSDLRGAKPRYSYGPKQFTLTFGSDLDKAAYILAQDKPSLRDADYMKFYQDATGADRAQARARGREIRSMIKEQARDAEPGNLTVPKYDRHPTPARLSSEAGSLALGDIREAITSEGDPLERFTKNVLLQRTAESARSTAITAHAFREAHDLIDKLPADQQLNLAYGMEGSLDLQMKSGMVPDTPFLRTVAAKMRDILTTKREEMNKLDPKVLNHYYENYWPREWKMPGLARSIWERMRGAKSFRGTSLKGRASFMRHRTLTDPVTGDPVSMRRAVEQFGMEPVSNNPVDIFLLKTAEMDRFKSGQHILKDITNAGLKRTFSSVRSVPEGWEKFDPRYAGVDQYGPEGVVRTLNRFMEPGLFNSPNPILRGGLNIVRKFNAIHNQALVSLSAFHAGLVTTSGLVADFGDAVRAFAKGDPKAAIRAISTDSSPVGYLSHYMKGYLEPGSLGPDIEQLIQNAVKGGMKPQLADLYRTDATMAFRKAISDHNPWGAAANSVPALLQTLSGPIMRGLVPRAKIIASLMAVKHDMESLGPDATDAAQRNAFARSVQSTEDWFGQMDPDNLVISSKYWNRTLADALGTTFKFVEFSYGTLRGMYGAAADLRFLAKGQVTPRLARAIAFPFVMYVLGSSVQMMMTGQSPRDGDTWIRDGFEPRTGRINPDGTRERLNLPTYWRTAVQWSKPTIDVIHGDLDAATTDLTSAVRGRISGGVDTMIMWLTNKDFFGREIRKPHIEDPRPLRPLEQLFDFTKAVVKDMDPISIRYASEAIQKGEGPTAVAQRVGGIQPVSARENRTAAQNKISEFIGENMGDRPMTDEEYEAKQLRADIRAHAKTGDYSGIGPAMAAGEINPKQGARFLKDAEKSLYDRADTLSTEQFIQVWDVATPAEKRMMKLPLLKERTRVMLGPIDERSRLMPLYNKAWLEVRQ